MKTKKNFFSLASLLFTVLVFLSTSLISLSIAQSKESTTAVNELRDRSRNGVNFRTNPLYLFLGGFNAEVDFNLTSNFTLGPTFLYVQKSKFYDYEKLQATVFGLQANKFFSQSSYEDSWYLGLKLEFTQATGNYYEYNKNRSTYRDSAMMTGLGGGYQWVWENFNLRLGGKALLLLDREVKDPLFYDIDFTLGWAI